MTTTTSHSPSSPATYLTGEAEAAKGGYHRLGANPTDPGVDFTVLAPRAQAVYLCVFSDADATATETRYPMHRHEGGVWSAHLPQAGFGTVYGYRVDGPWEPARGLVFNPAKLLLDPYGKGLASETVLDPRLYAHEVDDHLAPRKGEYQRNDDDSAPVMARSVVVDTGSFPVIEKPRIPWDETVIYELHVKGFTKNLPGVPKHLRGTYAGLAHPAAIAHLRALGVTTIELLPIHAKFDEPFLAAKGLTNYWGYSTLSYFTPEPSYATAAAQKQGAQAVLDEVRGMVSILHQHGFEVVLDVVYNHTAEGGQPGPTLSWRGFDQNLYYRHTTHEPVHMIDDTGCGNTVNFDEASVLQMTLDSLRYWSEDIGVDGFRFDLAATLGRYATGFTPRHPFLMAIAADPILGADKLIAEPWDIGPGGWQTGNFPLPWSEWNDRYRDTIRSFWLADFANLEAGRPSQGPNDLATRISGSADLFGATVGHARSPRASVNFVTAHDGFTLADLTTYNHKNNSANLENNRDGTSSNMSWNHGVEGHRRLPNPDGLNGADSQMLASVFYARERSMRNILATLLISAGTPMLVAGDEFARTQQGNNNAYCQDSEISWIDWQLDSWQHDLFDTTRYLIGLRRTHPVLRPNTFAQGTSLNGDAIADLTWRTADDEPFQGHNWHQASHRTLQMLRSGAAFADSDLLVVFNATLNSATVTLTQGRGRNYRLVFDSSWTNPSQGGAIADVADHSYCDLVRPGSIVDIEPQSIQLYLTQ
ncbi:MAG: glycogen debranching protein GlgX [Actinomycetaceae bacterium]|nr:glycogen debranching protein GlgX [Actinomycetaceae bacterium]